MQQIKASLINGLWKLKTRMSSGWNLSETLFRQNQPQPNLIEESKQDYEIRVSPDKRIITQNIDRRNQQETFSFQDGPPVSENKQLYYSYGY